MESNIEKICREIQAPIDSFDIRKMILDATVPFEWDIKDHPIKKLGYFYYGIGDGFKFKPEKVNQCDELTLWKLYGIIQNYWLVHYEQWNDELAEENY